STSTLQSALTPMCFCVHPSPSTQIYALSPTRRSSDLCCPASRTPILPEAVFDLPDAETTTRLGAAVAPLLETGETVLLYGPLGRSEEHTSELQSRENLVCRLLLEKKKTTGWRSEL